MAREDGKKSKTNSERHRLTYSHAARVEQSKLTMAI
jgi:hypothetical protein